MVWQVFFQDTICFIMWHPFPFQERTGQAAEDDEEIESFTAENFEADVATNDEPTTETEQGKDEL